jgi:acyl-CoA dehydrogenase
MPAGGTTMIDFELSEDIQRSRDMIHMVAEQAMRPISREYDEREHEKPWDFLTMMWQASANSPVSFGGDGKKEKKGTDAPSHRHLMSAVTIEELSWGDAGLYLSIPNSGLGGAAVAAAGTPEQRQRFLARFRGGEPKWGAMAITEPGCGSDSAAITTTARRDGDSWVINGTKIFVTSGLMAAEKSDGFVVVWATVDKSAGRAGIKAFVVERGTPGMTVVKCENKMGIRASDTAMIVFEDCRIPTDNLLGSPVVQKQSSEGFKGVMATFDATRPAVAASALGIGRAAVDYVREALEKEGITIRYGVAPTRLTAIERDFMEMEANLQAARLLTWRASWMMDQGLHNNLEASMAKAKAGLAVTQVTQKAVELLGPLGYSRRCLLEKWMRDAKINDIFEGTQQINLMIVARRILGYSSKELN